MKKTITFTLLALLTLQISAGKPSREVKPYVINSPRMGAMVYALPMTVVEVEINAACTVSKPGPFAQYAERYLADPNAITRESEVWKFESARIIDHPVPDSSRMFVVSGETGEVRFSDNDLLLKSVGCWPADEFKHKGHRHHDTSDVDTIFHTELLGEECLTSTSIPKMAERAAKQIFQLREARLAILSCDVNHQPDGSATKEILERIDREERELTALFIGKKIVLHSSRCFPVDPSSKKVNLIIARMSTLEGISSADDMIGTPIYVNVIPSMTTAPAETKKDKSARKGYFYNVPGSVEITVRHGDKFSFSRSLKVSQNGYCTWLNPAVSNILFNCNGTIKSLK